MCHRTRRLAPFDRPCRLSVPPSDATAMGAQHEAHLAGASKWGTASRAWPRFTVYSYPCQRPRSRNRQTGESESSGGNAESSRRESCVAPHSVYPYFLYIATSRGCTPCSGHTRRVPLKKDASLDFPERADHLVESTSTAVKAGQRYAGDVESCSLPAQLSVGTRALDCVLPRRHRSFTCTDKEMLRLTVAYAIAAYLSVLAFAQDSSAPVSVATIAPLPKPRASLTDALPFSVDPDTSQVCATSCFATKITEAGYLAPSVSATDLAGTTFPFPTRLHALR